MLRINLLPPYIYAGKAKGRVAALWAIILIAIVGALFFVISGIRAETAKFNADAAALEGTKQKALADASKAQQINSDSATIRAKADFVKNAVSHDQKTYPDLVRSVVMYTWNRVLYDYIRPEGQTVSMSAFTPSLTDVAHYIMAMERNPDITRVDIRMSSIPGFGGGQGQQAAGQEQAPGLRPEGGGGHNFLATLNLVKPIPPGPTFGGGGGGQQPGTGMPGMGGPGMMSGGMGGGMSGGMMSGGMGGGMSGGMSGRPGAMSAQ